MRPRQMVPAPQTTYQLIARNLHRSRGRSHKQQSKIPTLSVWAFWCYWNHCVVLRPHNRKAQWGHKVAESDHLTGFSTKNPAWKGTVTQSPLGSCHWNLSPATDRSWLSLVLKKEVSSLGLIQQILASQLGTEDSMVNKTDLSHLCGAYSVVWKTDIQ